MVVSKPRWCLPTAGLHTVYRPLVLIVVTHAKSAIFSVGFRVVAAASTSIRIIRIAKRNRRSACHRWGASRGDSVKDGTKTAQGKRQA